MEGLNDHLMTLNCRCLLINIESKSAIEQQPAVG